MKRFYLLLSVGLLCCLLSCHWFEKNPLFQLKSAEETGVGFINTITDTDSLNILDYLYYYNGAGMAAADFDNDGLIDLYFVSNTSSNHLYRNKGKWQFEDITERAGLEGSGNWNTGVIVVDINNDGWKDIYLCTIGNYKNLKGKNQLYVNQANGTFLEQASSYGLDLVAFSTHATFFDYDKDNDLDMLLLCHSVHSTANHGDTSLRNVFSPISGIHLYRNESGKYVQRSRAVGFTPSALGYGLGMAVGDLNHDGWEDIFISNDFHEGDKLYINNKGKTFSEEGGKRMAHFSNFSMGNTMYDINHDGYLDIISTDMLPLDREVLRSTESELSYDFYQSKLRYGYHVQYSRNALQLSTQQSKRFVDIALYAGVAATDWTWGVLAHDFNHDGYSDLFFTNGIKRRLNDLDYLNYLQLAQKTYSDYNNRAAFDQDVINQMPKGDVPNQIFQGNDNLQFKHMTNNWGMAKPSLSHGSVAVDLDNDGDLDIVTNNMNTQASLYENTVNTIDKLSQKTHYLLIDIHGDGKNKDGIGTSVFVKKSPHQVQHMQQYYHTGFMSSKASSLHAGLGKDSIVDILVVWPDTSVQYFYGVKGNQQLTIKQKKTNPTPNTLQATIDSFIASPMERKIKFPKLIKKKINFPWIHEENEYVDFSRNSLLPHLYSQQGPQIAIGDLDANGSEDIYLGGACFQEKQLAFLNRHLKPTLQNPFSEAHTTYMEVVAASIQDMDMDGSEDILVATAGGDPHYLAICGIALFSKDVSSSTYHYHMIEDSAMITSMQVADINGDGLPDIIASIWEGVLTYSRGSRLCIWENKGHNHFEKKTTSWIANAHFDGVIQDIAFDDINQDGFHDILIAGEWLPISILYGEKNQFAAPVNIATSGLWQSITVLDIDRNGHKDIVAGNWGLNSKLTASKSKPLKLFYGDIDQNGFEDLLLSLSDGGDYVPFRTQQNLEKQMPYLRKDFYRYGEAAKMSVFEMFHDRLSKEQFFEAEELASQALLQFSENNFKAINLPYQTQWSPICESMAYQSRQYHGVWLSANYFGVVPLEGRYDAGMPGFLTWDQQKNELIFKYYAQMLLPTDLPITDFATLNYRSEEVLVVASNNGPLQFFRIL